MEGYGEEVLYNARSLGLRVKDVEAQGKVLKTYLEALSDASPES